MAKDILKRKKHEIILNELFQRRERNNLHCQINDCEVTPYMQGANNTIDKMIEFIRDLNKK